MRRRLAITLAIALPTALLIAWIGKHTYWEDVKVPMLPKGEALVNPFYATQRFAEKLGATTTWDRMLTRPDTRAVIVISNWHWTLNRGRAAALEHWVDEGGRLVVDDSLIDADDAFEKWSGIVRQYPSPETIKKWTSAEVPTCRTVDEEFDGRSTSRQRRELQLCDDLGFSWLESKRDPRWTLRDKTGIQAMRVSIGRGSVTVMNAAPFTDESLLEGDNGRVFVAATDLRRGDEMHFLSENEYPSLLALAWHYGAAAIAVFVALLAALLWRGAIRFGPPAPAPAAARRSLADQVRGTGRFALRYGSGQALHAACVRALSEAAQRRIKGYGALAPEERIAALARLSGFDRDSLAAAIHHPGWRTAAELRRTLALLEEARRETLATTTKVAHGTR